MCLLCLGFYNVITKFVLIGEVYYSKLWATKTARHIRFIQHSCVVTQISAYYPL